MLGTSKAGGITSSCICKSNIHTSTLQYSKAPVLQGHLFRQLFLGRSSGSLQGSASLPSLQFCLSLCPWFSSFAPQGGCATAENAQNQAAPCGWCWYNQGFSQEEATAWEWTEVQCGCTLRGKVGNRHAEGERLWKMAAEIVVTGKDETKILFC